MATKKKKSKSRKPARRAARGKPTRAAICGKMDRQFGIQKTRAGYCLTYQGKFIKRRGKRMPCLSQKASAQHVLKNLRHMACQVY